MSVTMTIRVNGVDVSTATVDYNAGMNVQRVMEFAYIGEEGSSATKPEFAFSILYFGYGPDGRYLGYELIALDGISAQSGADRSSFYFWELLVNGAETTTGMDETIVQDGDAVTWQYTAYSDSRHAGTRAEHVRALLAR